MAFCRKKRKSIIKLIPLLLIFSLLQQKILSQNNDEAIKAAYSLQAEKPGLKNSYTAFLIKLNKDDAENFKNKFQQKILRQVNTQWFVVKNTDVGFKQFHVLELLRANNKFKLSSPAGLSKLTTSKLYKCIVEVTDSIQFKSDMLSYNKPIQSSYKNIFIIKTSASFVADTLINLDYVISADIKPQQPKPETVINDYDNSENAINLFFSQYPLINGNGLTASVKENLFDTTDIDFKNRFIQSGLEADTTSSHATTMATLIAGGGNSFESAKGIAWASSVASSDFTNLLPDDDSYFNEHNISVQNNSYGVGIENFYGADAAAYDQSAIDNPYLLYIFSAGNSGTGTPEDGNYKNIEGFSNLTGSFKQAKNILTVGSVDSFYRVASLSSKGPAYDGRIKPELVAYGNDGSSGAAAITSGAVLAVQSAYQSVHHDSLPPNALTKSIIINSADDVYNAGPDFYSGFGNVNVNNAVTDALDNKFFSDNIRQDEMKSFTIHIPANIHNLKITLVWNDATNTANAFKALVNDLDLSLENINNGIVYKPWVLNINADKTALLSNAIRGRDSLNNVEQITVSKPAEGNYIIHVKGHNIPAGPQLFYIAYTFYAENNFTFISPVSNSHFMPEGKNIFRWSSTFTSAKGKLEYSIDKGNSWHTISSNINLAKKYFEWTAPDTNVVALARITINNKIFYSDTFDISTQPYPVVGFSCGDSALISWDKQKGIDAYTIFSLGDKYLQPIATTNDTFYVVKNAPSEFIAVAPVLNNHTGIKSYTFDYSAQGVGCYISNFLADPDGDNASLKLYLGTTFNIKNAVFQQLVAGVWTGIKTIESINTLTVNYVSPMQQGINLYRAVITLDNGSTITSNEASVNFLNNTPYIIYPNPAAAKQGFYILSQNISSYTIVLYDVMGRKLLQQKIAQQRQRVITSNFAKGIYLAVIYDDKNHPVFKTKIVID
ncbi:S8 family peptidase [Parafilimonas terrae]|uniref:Por secretion system C-terminal sorting domain-containing protein n=1 Tax=Parafilimonas terrae TaxID=1465490 RepID=A0A1I5R1Y1_9BACT|nr:S8 family peptidase [Parafilimonas terrae]SFP52380.1 Por secretion system C-terminal sorting domain-containing protein [Parafilimonas terrae]